MEQGDVFLADVILDESQICNLTKDFRRLCDEISESGRIIFTGRRNTGKSSLLKSKVIPWFLKMNPDGIAFFVDVMGVKSLEHLDRLFTIAFNHAYQKVRPAKSFLEKIGQVVKQSRPRITVDSMSGEISFSLFTQESERNLRIDEILQILNEYQKQYPVLIVIDEVQDICSVPQGEARLRDALQNISGAIPVVVLGSKQHLLTEMFGRPKAPFANWGKALEISRITPEECLPYVNRRLNKGEAQLNLETMTYLCRRMEFIPECINLVCEDIRRGSIKSIITILHMEASIKHVIESKESIFRSLLGYHSENEQKFMRELARSQPITQLYKSQFTSKIKLSNGTLKPLVKRLLDQGMILTDVDGYQISDPLLREYLILN